MEKKFENRQPSEYFAAGVVKKHFHFAGEAECKKRAELIFMWRFFRKKPGQVNPAKQEQPRVLKSTLICLSEREFLGFAREIFNRQQEFERDGKSTYPSSKKYNVLSRGGDQPAEKKRVICTQAIFRFGVEKESNDPDALWIVNHVVSE